ncbi:hypothetical protein Gotur_016726 [Gossypium turneri]
MSKWMCNLKRQSQLRLILQTQNGNGLRIA